MTDAARSAAETIVVAMFDQLGCAVSARSVEYLIRTEMAELEMPKMIREREAEIDRLRADSRRLEALLDPANSFKIWIAVAQFNENGRFIGHEAADSREEIDEVLGREAPDDGE